MPTFDVRCESCGRTEEVFLTSAGRVLDARRCCARNMTRVYTLATHQSTGFEPFWHPHLGHKPVWVESWGHYRQLLKERNASNELAT